MSTVRDAVIQAAIKQNMAAPTEGNGVAWTAPSATLFEIADVVSELLAAIPEPHRTDDLREFMAIIDLAMADDIDQKDAA